MRNVRRHTTRSVSKLVRVVLFGLSSLTNCSDGVGTYQAMGGRIVKCTSCQGRGFVVCRTCFDYYDEDPNDIEAIRDLMARMPD